MNRAAVAPSIFVRKTADTGIREGSTGSVAVTPRAREAKRLSQGSATMRPRRKTIRFERRGVQDRQILTDELLEQIARSHTPEGFLEYEDGADRDLSGYLNELLEAKGLRKATVIKNAHLNETFGYQIFSGARGAGRDKVLAIGLAMGVSLREMRLLLNHADCGDLYSKNRRDAIIIFCITHGYNLSRTDDELFRFGEKTVSDDGAN